MSSANSRTKAAEPDASAQILASPDTSATLPGPADAGVSTQDALPPAPTMPNQAELDLARARAQASINLDTEPMTFPEVSADEISRLNAGGGVFPGGSALADIASLAELERPKTQLEAMGAAAAAEHHRRQAEAFDQHAQQVAEIPLAQREAFVEDINRDRARRNEAPIGAQINTRGEISRVGQALAAQREYIVYMFPYFEQDQESRAPLNREFSIGMKPFSIPTGRHFKLPRDIVEFCVTYGWCECPRELQAEFELKNIRGSFFAPRSAFALQTDSQPGGLFLGNGRGASFAELANR